MGVRASNVSICCYFTAICPPRLCLRLDSQGRVPGPLAKTVLTPATSSTCVRSGHRQGSVFAERREPMQSCTFVDRESEATGGRRGGGGERMDFFFCSNDTPRLSGEQSP